jgi:hypothetical protein
MSRVKRLNHPSLIQWTIGVIQWTIGVIPWTIGVIQWTIGVIPWTIGVIPWTIGVIQWTIGVIPWTIGVIQRTIGVIQWTIGLIIIVYERILAFWYRTKTILPKLVYLFLAFWHRTKTILSEGLSCTKMRLGSFRPFKDPPSWRPPPEYLSRKFPFSFFLST